MCAPVSGCEYVSTGTRDAGEAVAVEILKLELRAVVSHLMCVLEQNSGSLCDQYVLLSAEPSL